MLTKVIGNPTELSFGLEKFNLKPVIRNFVDISIVEIPSTLPKSQWIFFSSANAVRSLIQQKIDFSDYKIACIGQGTAAAIPSGYHVSFIGKSSDTNKVAMEFASLASKQTVLFPVSNISNKTVQKALTPDLVSEAIVYKTTIVGQKVDAYPFIVFSSPSQWKGFCLENSPNKDQKIIAFGKTTASAIESDGFSVTGFLKSITVVELISTIKDHLGS